MSCPIALAADEIGEAWTILILREALKGASTFNVFAEKIPIAASTLTRRLNALVVKGFFVRVQYQTNPLRHRYELTAKARDLLPILLALGEWGNRWLSPQEKLISVTDETTGQQIKAGVVDLNTMKRLDVEHIFLKRTSKDIRRQKK